MSNLKQHYHLEIEQLVKKIVNKYRPDRIIAFGSTATGKVDEGSDIDLLVIKKTSKPFWQRVKKVLLFYDGYRSFDVSVLTPEELKQAESKGWYFITDEILKRGKTLYEKS